MRYCKATCEWVIVRSALGWEIAVNQGYASKELENAFQFLSSFHKLVSDQKGWWCSLCTPWSFCGTVVPWLQ